MKLYTCSGAPSPQRVGLYLRAKGLEIDTVEVDLRAGEHLSENFAQRSPNCTVPVLQLDDGRYLWESTAIRRWLEEQFPEPPLLGRDQWQRAAIDQWCHWLLFNGLLPVMDAFRNAAPGFRDHALVGRRPVAQIAELAVRGQQRYRDCLDDLDQRLARSEHVATDEFSVADIDAVVLVDFARRAVKIEPAGDHAAIVRWYSACQARLGLNEPDAA